MGRREKSLGGKGKKQDKPKMKGKNKKFVGDWAAVQEEKVENRVHSQTGREKKWCKTEIECHQRTKEQLRKTNGGKTSEQRK